MAELVADAVSFFSSMGSRRHGMVTAAPCLETHPADCWGRCTPFWSWLLPRSGMTSLQGRAKGMMECWYTRAERQPGERGEMVSAGLGTQVPLVLVYCLSGWTGTRFLVGFFTVVLMPRVAFLVAETTTPTEGLGRWQRCQGHLRNNEWGRGAPQSTLALE